MCLNNNRSLLKGEKGLNFRSLIINNKGGGMKKILRAGLFILICILICMIVFEGVYLLALEGEIAEEQKKRKERMERRRVVEGINTQLFGEYPLIKKMYKSQGLSGSISGSYFLFFGSTTGKLSTEPILTFFWKSKENQVLATTLPLSKFQFIIDDSKKTPTVEFKFNKRMRQIIYDYYIRHRSEPVNLNEWKKGIFLAIVKISSSDFKKEVLSFENEKQRGE